MQLAKSRCCSSRLHCKMLGVATDERLTSLLAAMLTRQLLDCSCLATAPFAWLAKQLGALTGREQPSSCLVYAAAKSGALICHCEAEAVH